MSTVGLAYVFINFKQAGRFGHVGWGVSADGGQSFLYGSTDHLFRSSYLDLAAWWRYMSVPSGGDNDWWVGEGSEDDMLSAMRATPGRIRYHAYKIIETPDFDFTPARLEAFKQKDGGWSLWSNNCVHQVHRILSLYGAEPLVPSPYRNLTNIIPRVWFARIGAESRFL